MFKSHLNELAQRQGVPSPSFCVSFDGPPHSPHFSATVTFNGDPPETFSSPRQSSKSGEAQNAAARAALEHKLAQSPAVGFGVHKTRLDGLTALAGVLPPSYRVTSTGPSHVPTFVSTVHVARAGSEGLRCAGEAAMNRKQADLNAALAALVHLWRSTGRGDTSSLPSLDVLADANTSHLVEALRRSVEAPEEGGRGAEAAEEQDRSGHGEGNGLVEAPEEGGKGAEVAEGQDRTGQGEGNGVVEAPEEGARGAEALEEQERAGQGEGNGVVEQEEGHNLERGDAHNVGPQAEHRPELPSNGGAEVPAAQGGEEGSGGVAGEADITVGEQACAHMLASLKREQPGVKAEAQENEKKSRVEG